jgi:archaellum component FlaF (FlaF/FlaG flagellin family)
MQKSWGLVAACIVLAALFVALAVFYATANTSFLASETGHHTKHAILFAALALLSLVAASFARPRRAGA